MPGNMLSKMYTHFFELFTEANYFLTNREFCERKYLFKKRVTDITIQSLWILNQLYDELYKPMMKLKKNCEISVEWSQKSAYISRNSYDSWFFGLHFMENYQDFFVASSDRFRYRFPTHKSTLPQMLLYACLCV